MPGPGAKVAALLLLLATPALAQQPARGSDEQVRKIIHEGLDEALREQVSHLFQTWLKHGGEQSRAGVGLRRAIDAYRRAIVAVDTKDLSEIEGTFKVQSERSRPIQLRKRQ